MSIKIEQKIIKSEVMGKASSTQEATSEPLKADVIHMHEKLARPESLQGITYKIKTPLSEHALYVTINDIVLNPDTEHELRRPFEIFINSKNMEHFQWIIALTRILSAVFRKGGDVTFLVDELHSVFDPQGGYFKKGGRYTPSIVAEIGDVIEQHIKHDSEKFCVANFFVPGFRHARQRCHVGPLAAPCPKIRGAVSHLKVAVDPRCQVVRQFLLPQEFSFLFYSIFADLKAGADRAGRVVLEFLVEQSLQLDQ